MSASPESAAFNLTEATALLTRTPAALDALLRGLPERWTHSNEGDRNGEPTWNAYNIVGHLASTERLDWMPRVQFLLAHGNSRPFEKVDRSGKASRGTTIPELLAEFAQLRQQSLTTLASLNLQPADLERTGTHGVFGPVTLAQLLATWTTHDLNHLHQLSRVLAHQYREAVGPWSAYLGVLHCTGHGTA